MSEAPDKNEHSPLDELIAGLQGIVGSTDTDPQHIQNLLQGLGFPNPSVSVTVEAIRSRASEWLARLSNAKTHGLLAFETVQGREAIEARLGALPVHYFDTEIVNTALQNLSDGSVYIPDDVQANLAQAFPQQLSAEVQRQLVLLQRHSQYGAKPIVLQIPPRICIDGEEVELSAANVQRLNPFYQKENPDYYGFFGYQGAVTEQKRQAPPTPTLRAWSADVLTETKYMQTTETQRMCRARLLELGVQDAPVDSDVLIAHMLHQLIAPEDNDEEVHMLLDDAQCIPEKTTCSILYRHPVTFYVRGLGGRPPCGIGACIEIQ